MFLQKKTGIILKLQKNRVKTLPSPLKTVKVLSGLVCDSYQNKL